ncbi:MAG: hypothetical protein HZB10_01535 [Candidatus Yonathbacteria bacterium]|nr:hypothetical protein [Candidatus Yonathbacteria bacterium]
MDKAISITDLFSVAGMDHQGKIIISHPDMSGLETNPKDDWLYIGLLAIENIAQRKGRATTSAAFIGSGNGIETIAALKLLSSLKTLYVIDLSPDVQPGVIANITANTGELLKGVQTFCLQGRDGHPLPQRVDLIYGNLPLIMMDREEIRCHPLAMTTLTDAEAYTHLSQGPHDLLRRYSLLSQLGFLLSAKEKLNLDGTLLTLIGGRVPYYAITECFQRAGLGYRKLFTSIKRQSDPQFLKQYAEVEVKEDVVFAFYDYKKAAEIIQGALNIAIPELIPHMDDEELKALLVPALLSAKEAYEQSRNGRAIAHIAHAFEAWNISV